MSYRHIFENSKDGKCPLCGSQAEEHRNNSHTILNGWYCSNKNCKYSFANELLKWEKIDSERKCYIATAVYNSYNVPEVLCLRKYRDEILYSSIFEILSRILHELLYSYQSCLILIPAPMRLHLHHHAYTQS